ncbi:rhamnan synthesis F family protein [Ectopseudomonas chengduensis]
MIQVLKSLNWIRIIKKSGLFDEDFYLLSYPDVRSLDVDPVKHYVKFGADENRNPSATFDTKHYKSLHKDIEESRLNPLVHFILNKKNHIAKDESPAGETDCELKDFDIINRSGLFNRDFYCSTYKDLVNLEDDPLWHFVKHGWREGRNPNEDFNTNEYIDAFGGAIVGNPLVHCITNNGSVGNSSAGAFNEDAPMFTTSQLAHADVNNIHANVAKAPIVESDKEAIDLIRALNITDEHRMIEFIKGKINSIKVKGFFSSEDYLDLYPDIKAAKVNPLKHFLLHGRKEGRVGYLDLLSHVHKGLKEYDSNKETVVLVSHESSATGAPLLGFGIADKLVEKYNIVHIVIKEKNIHQVFFSNCDTILSGIEKKPYIYSFLFLKELLEHRPVKCVMINSVVGYQVMHAAYKLNIPTVFLIHEFAEYMRPFGTMIDAVLYSDIVVTPAKIIQKSIQKEIRRFTNYKNVPSNMNILPQGKLPYIPDTYGDNSTTEELYKKIGVENKDDYKIIVGSGWIQTRKGVDLFVAAARYIKSLYNGKCKFVWVGEGFDPDNDLAYSIYLEREIEFSGLGSDFILLEHQKNLDAIFSIAHVFVLTSRMDPFPNVVIDALSHDLHIACFSDASGSAEFLVEKQANCTVVDFVDTYELAKGVSVYLQSDNKKPNPNKQIVQDYLDFDKYVARLDEFIDQAVSFREKSNSIVNYLLENKALDVDYFGGKGTAEEKYRKYVENGLKGIHFHNPRVGFSEIEWLERYSKSNYSVVPLYEALISKDVVEHSVFKLPGKYCGKLNFSYAVHLHLYYPEMADFFSEYFKCLPGGYDLFITVTQCNDIESIKLKFECCGASLVEVICVENIGRDMGPFIFALKEKLCAGNYEVVGHFHSKKSLDLEANDGGQWLEYLMRHLIGDVSNAASVLSIFNNAAIGLVFPEDTNTVDIGENTEYVAKLCDMMQIPLITQTPVFPVGNMFWARVDAIKNLFDLVPENILQREPLPYDGSFMHAIERITPHLIESNGYQYSTVHIPGLAWK